VHKVARHVTEVRFKSLCRQASLPPRQNNKILPVEFCHAIIKRSIKFIFSSLIL
jgi:hypothetical protein